MIVGTAGHIDHGKSALVEALTGRTVDRLAEERRRGITIDLNFAPLVIPGEAPMGIVDVPGHEDFVRTMVAGASGIDLVLLVVDAAEGPRPQTYEHLTIVEQLGIPAGIPVITKIDLVEPDWLELVQADVAALTARSVVAFAEPALVSARTGAGLEDLRARLATACAAWRPRRTRDLFRLPIDRVFSLPGVGTVVTGTVWSGTARVGEMVRVLPGGGRARIRSIEGFGEECDEATAGHRHALGLVGVTKGEIQRGQVVVAESAPWRVTTVLDVHLAVDVRAPRPVTTRTRLRLHVGTAEILARVHPRATIVPGTSGIARLALETPALVRGGDRFVLRTYSPVTTLGGGIVLDPSPPPRAKASEAAEAPEPAGRLALLATRRPGGLPVEEVPIVLGTEPSDTDDLVAASGLARLGDVVFAPGLVAAATQRILRALAEQHRLHPADWGMSLETLRQALHVPDPVRDGSLAGLERDRAIEVKEGMVRLPSHRPQVAGGEESIDRLVAIIASHGLAAPTVAELEGMQAIPEIAATLRLAAAAGRIELVERGRYVAREALDAFTLLLRRTAEPATGVVTPARLREETGLTRKFLIPLLEWADRQGITARTGDTRRLRPHHPPIPTENADVKPTPCRHPEERSGKGSG